MEATLQNPEDTILKFEKYATIQRQPSTITMRTTGSDSSDSLAINELEEHHTRAEENGSTDVYFTRDYIARVNEVARNENKKLRLNLGLPIDPSKIARHQPIKSLIQLVHRFLLLVENPLFRIWSQYIPLKLRQKLTLVAWKIYFPLHKLLIGRKTGLHNDASLEYHALTTIMYWGRLFPVTVRRMRYALSQMHVNHSPDMYPTWKSLMKNPAPCNCRNKSNGHKYGIRGHVYEVFHEMDTKRSQSTALDSKTEMTVTGKYIQHSSRPSEKIIFWIFGGAFLAGDVDGNLGVSEKMGMMVGEGGQMRDLFIPDYRLVPEHNLDDAVHDITLAYEWLIYERGVKPENVVLLGISSGGGLAVLLMQALAEFQRKMEDKGETYNLMPAGGVLMGPFVDYTKPKGSFEEFVKHDLVVNDSVFEEGIPFLEIVLGSHDNRVKASPVYGNFKGLAPLCICVSEHEVVYDQAMLLAGRAKDQGVDVTVGAWKYMCHVFPMLCAFVPEGREGFQFMADWIKKH